MTQTVPETGQTFAPALGQGQAGRWPKTAPLAAGLYFVSTPIGAARDITLRGLDILATADVLAAEDTRTLRHLMEIHGVALADRPILPYHDHNGAQMRPKLMRAIAEGKSVAYASEAGTPLVADPGFALGRAAIADGHMIIGAPGPSAVLAALTVSGLPTDRFLFAGFPPPTASARRKWLEDLADLQATLVIYESPKRIAVLLATMADIFGPDRPAALCRELTKRFEDVRRAPLSALATALAETPVKGEIVLVIDRAAIPETDPATLQAALEQALKTASLRDAATDVAKMFGVSRKTIYNLGLKIGGDS